MACRERCGVVPVKTCAVLGLWILTLSACHKQGAAIAQRSYRMGFALSAPRPDFSTYIAALDLWSTRADAAIISNELPWDSLLSGEDPTTYILSNYQGLVNFYRSKHFSLWIYLDPENGLDRAADADALVRRGKSIAQPDVQQIDRRFAVLMDSLLRPDHMGFALETNLIRGGAPDSIYQGVRQAVNGAAQDLRKTDPQVKLGVSVQVDYAWGKLTHTGYIGIAQDLIDFPFVQELGLSSYPYFNFSNPSELPINYYSALVQGKNLPVFVSEGGWTSQSITGFGGAHIVSSPQLQQAYIDKQKILLDQAQAMALFQLTFTDIEVSSLPPTTNPTINYFAWIGMVDTNLAAKPALAAWDSLFRLPLKAGR